MDVKNIKTAMPKAITGAKIDWSWGQKTKLGCDNCAREKTQNVEGRQAKET